MKKTLLYSATVLLLAAVACNKTDNVPAEGDGLIRFAPVAENTRALIYQDNLTSETFQVYDFKDDAKYIEDKIKYVNDSWKYVSEEDYLWKAGSHQLFGYSEAFGALPDSKQITFTKVLTTKPADQVDMLYSQIVNTTADAWKHTAGNTKETPVKLNLKHLFSAVRIAVTNGKTEQIRLNSVTIPTIPNSATATIDYRGSEVAVIIRPAPTAGTTPFVSAAAAANVDISPNGALDLLAQVPATGNPTYFMVWPQTIPDMAITVKYTQNGNIYEATATIPSIQWVAGKLYTYTLNIGNADDILLNFTVKDWIAGNGDEGETQEFE